MRLDRGCLRGRDSSGTGEIEGGGFSGWIWRWIQRVVNPVGFGMVLGKKMGMKLQPILGGGFKYFLFSPLFGEDFQFD